MRCVHVQVYVCMHEYTVHMRCVHVQVYVCMHEYVYVHFCDMCTCIIFIVSEYDMYMYIRSDIENWLSAGGHSSGGRALTA